MLHKNIGVGNNHIPYNWVFTDTIMRESSTGYISSDIGKLSFQIDDSSIWLLTSTAPIWNKITSNNLYTGTTTPSDLLGKSGDVYIDTTNVVLYPEKPSDSFWSSGVELIPKSLKIYKHIQSSPNTSWTINHNLNKNPSISLYTVGSTEFLGDITHTSLTQSIITLTTAISGFAICN